MSNNCFLCIFSFLNLNFCLSTFVDVSDGLLILNINASAVIAHLNNICIYWLLLLGGGDVNTFLLDFYLLIDVLPLQIFFNINTKFLAPKAELPRFRSHSCSRLLQQHTLARQQQRYHQLRNLPRHLHQLSSRLVQVELQRSRYHSSSERLLVPMMTPRGHYRFRLLPQPQVLQYHSSFERLQGRSIIRLPSPFQHLRQSL